MNGLRRLLGLRRRSDKVKLALLLFLLGALLGADLVSSAFRFFSEASKPTEYVLASAAQGAALEGRLQGMGQHEGVISVSRQREYTLTSGGREITVAEVSPEYLSACFGLSPRGAGREFYLGRGAFLSLCGPKAESPARLTCERDGESFSGAFILCPGLPENAALARGSSATLSGAGTVRAMLDGRDISGLDAAWLEEQGFGIENGDELAEGSRRLELLGVKLRYGGLAFVLALLLGGQLFAAGFREQKGP